ncbi:undecaprenyl-diphosphatase [Vulcanimicrobium alpinum]|uniref:Undecaprenyl-diphosphatase n=1 Tax=Vulcanimicrobium alpinum TaxID=3016050 RepID=A0AAN1XZ89_UNVUL|nr:undecaprenyl-diphosphate phosphatase [Vulcanimicrobium alpinum]BDE07073.1 undecaprenyl-diphosphatase [Vulcanimicrobium alpinum]
MRTVADVTFVQAMLLAVLQGVSELFPISSLGHTVLVPALLRWNIDEGSESFLAFVVVLHLGTALALIVFYRRDWIAIVRALVASVVRGRIGSDPIERTAWLLVAGTIPVGVLGVLFQSAVKSLFASPIPVSLFLFANGFVMLLGEWLRRRQHARPDHPYRRLPELTPRDGVLVGLAQSLALLPGISRSGSAIVAGLLRDLHHDDAARYSFLLATPVILAAAVLEIPTLFAPEAHVVLVESAVGCVVAGVTAYASVAFLTRWFKHNDLAPFAWYCVAAGAISCFLFVTKVIPS